MKTRLISYSQPTEEMRSHGITNAQELIAFCARVSNPANQIKNETSDKLIRYLIEHKHWSPLEMCNACIEIETTRDIGRQILRHRSFVFQEFSQRYSDPTQMDFQKREARLQDKNNRQGSLETDDARIASVWDRMQDSVISLAWEHYTHAINLGIAKEQARAILPEGCTPSRIYMSGSMRSWVHYIQLRTKWDTQKEHREIALSCADTLCSIFPMIDEFVDDENK